ncbi:MAG: lytic transglycosylase domain-containing protein [Candidatus Omnitrophica bacterium]|nr:lytic transglycosylase domain-containing protein [Candidatus Omnitrophota bacterium]
MKRRWFLLLPVMLLLDGLLVYWWWHQEREHRFDGVILAAADRYGVDPALIKAVVWRESRFSPKARGKAGEIGLMQIRSLAAGEWAQAENLWWFRAGELYDPAVNTRAGTWYLSRLLKRYAQTDDPLPYALADYNAGRSNVLRWNRGAAKTNSAAFVKQIDFPGTRDYVISVMRRMAYYRSRFPDWK